MKLILKERPKSPTIIEGFPGFGLVGTITTQFLIKHLNAKQIGSISSEDQVPITAIHEGKIVEPLSIFYDSKYNVVILHALTGVSGFEWKIADVIMELCKELKCKELISLEGISATNPEKTNIYFYANTEDNKKKFAKLNLEPLKEGLVIGVSGALLVKSKMPLSCVFIESHVNLADSMAAAKIIEVLDKYLKLKVDFTPLMKTAQEFETKLKTIITKNKEISGLQKSTKEIKQQLGYIG